MTTACTGRGTLVISRKTYNELAKIFVLESEELLGTALLVGGAQQRLFDDQWRWSGLLRAASFDLELLSGVRELRIEFADGAQGFCNQSSIDHHRGVVNLIGTGRPPRESFR